jgi:M6 family metalloprotease-like protein
VLPSRAQYEILMNTPDVDSIIAPTSSVKTFYKKASNGKLTVESRVLDWITLPNTEAYYANNGSGYVKLDED